MPHFTYHFSHLKHNESLLWRLLELLQLGLGLGDQLGDVLGLVELQAGLQLLDQGVSLVVEVTLDHMGEPLGRSPQLAQDGVPHIVPEHILVVRQRFFVACEQKNLDIDEQAFKCLERLSLQSPTAPLGPSKALKKL